MKTCDMCGIESDYLNLIDISIFRGEVCGECLSSTMSGIEYENE